MNNPKYIGILGVPNSGKTELARAIVYAQPNPEDWLIVDDYAPELQDELNIYMGAESTYIPNLMIAVRREMEQRMAERTGKNVIVCGTILDTMAYIAVKIEELASKPKQDLREQQVFREVQTNQVLAIMAEDLWRFTNSYYLEDKAEVRTIEYEGETIEHPWNQHYAYVDDAIKSLLARWGNYYSFKRGTTLEERLQRVMEDLTPSEEGETTT